MIETIALVLTGLGLTASIVYYASILRNANKTQQMALETRQTQLFMYLYDKWSSEDFIIKLLEILQWEWEDYQDYNRKYGYANKDKAVQRIAVGAFFEGLGVLVKNGQLKPELVDDLLSWNVVTYWEKFRPIIIQSRKEQNYPNMGEWTEYLYNQLKPIYEKDHLELAT